MAIAKEDKIVRGGDLATIGEQIKAKLAEKQDALVSGTNIKTVNNTSLLGGGDIIIADGIGFEDVASAEDGTIVITLTDGNTITVDLNHDHPNKPNYVLLESESDLPADPDADTLYLIPESE